MNQAGVGFTFPDEGLVAAHALQAHLSEDPDGYPSFAHPVWMQRTDVVGGIICRARLDLHMVAAGAMETVSPDRIFRRSSYRFRFQPLVHKDLDILHNQPQ